MLSSDNRQLFVNALRPPDGYQFDRGIGTTFSLDLVTLLVAPLSFALFDRTDVDEALQDPLILLEALRRNADRLTIFCQAGYISVPPKDNYLYRYLEDIVVEVKAPGGGVFHPKVWLLRYISEDAPTIYRLLNLSRNLTFDRSWDLILQMDGEVAERKVGFSRNRPLSDFVHTLPDLALREPSSRIKNDIELMADEIRKTNFLPPAGFKGYPEFYPSGIPGYRSYRFPNNSSHLMVISPFLTRPFINQITKNGDNHILISRVASIDEMPPRLRNRFKNIYVLDDMATSDPEDAAGLDEEIEIHDPSTNEDVELSGLHAKLFVMENGWDAKWLLGSANATDAAYRGRNVEFMIELNGKKSRFGIDKILGNEEDEFSLLALLKPYPESRQREEIEAAKIEAEKLAEQVRTWLVETEFSLEVQENDKAQFDLVLTAANKLRPLEGNFSISCWPVSLPIGYAQTLELSIINQPIIFPDINVLYITPFMAFQIEAKVDTCKHITRFVLNLPIKNLPPTRDDLIISAIIEDRGQFIRYLRLLLAGDATSAIDDFIQIGQVRQNDSSGWFDLDMPLMEDLIRALSRSPQNKIDRIAEIVEQLSRTPQGKEIIPKEFEQLWQAVMLAREEIK